MKADQSPFLVVLLLILILLNNCELIMDVPSSSHYVLCILSVITVY
jgi:hypothetical protein